MYLLSLCALTPWPFLPISEATWPKLVRKMDMKSVTREEIEQAISPLRYSTYRPLQINSEMWNYHMLSQKNKTKQKTPLVIYSSTTKWTWMKNRKRKRSLRNGRRERLKGKWVSVWLLSSFAFFCLSCYITDQAEMWTDYTVTPVSSPFECI